MRSLSLSLIAMSFLFLTLPVYAIQMTVQSVNSKTEGLGFTVNGKKHGGMGNKYHASGMPKGSYSFGMRLHGKDIGCVDKDGKKQIKITGNTHAVLTLSGKHCTVKINSK